MLFMLYHDVTDNKVKSFVFNSYHQLPSEIKQTITECAKEAGIQSDIEYIEGNIQENVPNGCGLFVIEAVKQLAETTTKNYVETLKNF
ncbi:deubiquitinase SseL, partial [Providencia vermicola]|nr:deubiquitinase SseL [Providencia vermicola]